MHSTQAQSPGLGLDELAPTNPSPRPLLVASLAEILTRAVALGDEEGARVIHEAIARLLGLVPAPEGRASAL
ncbi:MAG TPA: hypothetical protein VL242_46450 [Sorangium sp.]|nr:hypothetical protein [Sorangium sp.]